MPVEEISSGTVFDPTAIRTVKNDGGQMKNGNMEFSQLPALSRVEVFGTDGTKLLETTTDQEGKAMVGLNSLPKGTYIVRSASQTLKIIKK